MKQVYTGLAVVLGTILVLGSGGASAQSIWWETGMVKLRQANSGTTGDPIPAGADICSSTGCAKGGVAISAARNEFEPFQILIAAPSTSGVSGVNVTVSDLKSAQGAVIAGSVNGKPKNIVIYREHYLSIASSKLSSTAALPGLWPDALVPKIDEYFGQVRRMPTESGPAFPFYIAANNKQGIWVDVYVPLGTPAGLYTGTAQVTVGSVVKANIPIRLTVRGFDLPSTPTLKTAYALGVDEAKIGHYGSITATDSRYWEIICLYTKEMLMHRVSNETVIWPRPQVSSQTGKIDWSLPAISTTCNQRYPEFLNGTAALPNGKLPGAKVARARMVDGTGGVSMSAVQSVSYYKDYIQHIASMGWKSQLYYYLWDEPPYPGVNGKRRCDLNYNLTPSTAWSGAYHKSKFFKDNSLDIPIMITTNKQSFEDCFINYLGISNYNRYIDIWTVPNKLMDGKSNAGFPFNTNNRKGYDSVITAGKQLWWYHGCGNHGCVGSETGFPTPMVDLPAIYSRMFQWLTYNYSIGYSAPGPGTELYFETVYAYQVGNDPWKNIYYFSGNGDGTYFYPGRPDKIGGTTHIPIASIRLKMLREGIEDYEYLALVEAKKNKEGINGKSWIKTNILDPYLTAKDPKDGVMKMTTYNWNTAPGAATSATGLLRAREELAKVLSGSAGTVSGSSVGSPPPPSTPSGVVYSDTFDRPSNPGIGSQWNEYLLHYDLSANQVRTTDAGSHEALFLHSIGPTQSVAVNCKMTTTASSCGVMGRWSDSNNFYYAKIDVGLKNIVIMKKVKGTFISIAAAPRTMTYNTYYKVRLVTKGSSIAAYFGGETTPAISVVDSSLPTGNFTGLRSYASGAYTTGFDNFYVTVP